MTRRSCGLAALLLGFCLWWVSRAEIAGHVYLISWTILMPAAACLTGLLAVNAILRHRGWALSRSELLFIYLVLSVALPVAGFGMVRFLLPILGASAVPAAGSAALKLAPYLPAFTLPHNPAQSFPGFFSGRAPVPWAAWVVPIAVWSVVIAALCAAGFCASLLLRERWIEEERLTFPTVYLPLRMTEPGGGLFRQPLFWLGFAMPATFQSLLALNALYPSVPAVQLRVQYYPTFTTLPWSAFGTFPVGVYPMAVGLAYLIPTDTSFSLWFFYLFTKLVAVVGASFGVEVADVGASGARFPYLEEQAAGAWLCLGLLALWGWRRHAGRLLRSPAALGLAGSAALLFAFWVMLGMQASVVAVVLGLYGLLLIGGMRIRAQIGAQWILMPLVWNPNSVAVNVWGTRAFTPSSLALLTVLHAFVIDIRAHPMPGFMEAWKIGDQAGLKRSPLATALLVGLVVAIPLALVTSLAAWYDAGAAARGSAYPLAKARIAYTTWASWTGTERLSDTPGTLALLTGAAITALLSLLHTRFTAFPFHPIGYAAANTYTGRAFTISFFVAWLVKTLLLRYGGVRLYRTGLSLFLGIALGDILTQCAWTIIGMLLGFEVYGFVT